MDALADNAPPPLGTPGTDGCGWTLPRFGWIPCFLLVGFIRNPRIRYMSDCEAMICYCTETIYPQSLNSSPCLGPRTPDLETPSLLPPKAPNPIHLQAPNKNPQAPNSLNPQPSTLSPKPNPKSSTLNISRRSGEPIRAYAASGEMEKAPNRNDALKALEARIQVSR